VWSIALYVGTSTALANKVKWSGYKSAQTPVLCLGARHRKCSAEFKADAAPPEQGCHIWRLCTTTSSIECDISVISSSSSGSRVDVPALLRHSPVTGVAPPLLMYIRGQLQCDEKKGPSHFLKFNTLPGINLKIWKQGLCMAQNMFRSCIRRLELTEQGKRMNECRGGGLSVDHRDLAWV